MCATTEILMQIAQLWYVSRCLRDYHRACLPVKYANSEIRDAYHQVERNVPKTILSTARRPARYCLQVLTHSAEASGSEASESLWAADELQHSLEGIERRPSLETPEFITAEPQSCGVVEDLAGFSSECAIL